MIVLHRRECVRNALTRVHPSCGSIQRALLRGRGKLERVLQGLEELQGRPFDPALLLSELLLEMLGASMLGGFDFGLAASRRPHALRRRVRSTPRRLRSAASSSATWSGPSPSTLSVSPTTPSESIYCGGCRRLSPRAASHW